LFFFFSSDLEASHGNRTMLESFICELQRVDIQEINAPEIMHDIAAADDENSFLP
jgi:hypothetical protein